MNLFEIRLFDISCRIEDDFYSGFIDFSAKFCPFLIYYSEVEFKVDDFSHSLKIDSIVQNIVWKVRKYCEICDKI